LKYSFIYLISAIILFGCSSEKTTKLSSSVNAASDNSYQLALGDSLSESNQTAVCDSLVADSSEDALTSQLLERARGHYQSALDAEESGDSVHSANEFEYAIGILNELGDYPNIENNRDFNDLSRSIVADYEKYIANIDSLGSESSIFALRNKLNQIDESSDTTNQDRTQKIISTPSIPLVINGHVQQNIDFFQGRGREHFEKWLYLSGRYFPVMRKVFREEGVPQELMYLSMIESGLNPTAHSWARAVGLWQFVRGTGMLYGLKGNFWYDERRDFEKATHASARYLKDLYGEFGDWYLVLAAYNSGAGRVYRGIRRSGSTDFWKMRPNLPRETRNYVPQYIAAAVMTMDPKSYGFDVAPADSFAYETVTVKECVDLTVLAKCANTDVETLSDLNPELLRWCTPPGGNGYALRIPAGTKAAFQQNYAGLSDSEKRDYLVHDVRKRESLASIAKKYGISSAMLAEANHLTRKRVSVGQSLIIPVPPTKSFYHAENVVDDSQPRSARKRHAAQVASDSPQGKEKLVYKIRKNDSLGKIADWFDVRISDLRRWNEIPYGSSIQAGEMLNVWVPQDQKEKYAAINAWSDADHTKALVSNDESGDEKPVASAQPSSYWVKYRVKAGENLGKIAHRYSVGVEDLRKWNALTSSVVRKGQQLEILVEDTTATVSKASLAVVKDSVKTQKAVAYKVKKGDTLHSIASAFGVSINRLRSINKIRGNHLHVGQAIYIRS